MPPNFQPSTYSGFPPWQQQYLPPQGYQTNPLPQWLPRYTYGYDPHHAAQYPPNSAIVPPEYYGSQHHNVVPQSASHVPPSFYRNEYPTEISDDTMVTHHSYPQGSGESQQRDYQAEHRRKGKEKVSESAQQITARRQPKDGPISSVMFSNSYLTNAVGQEAWKQWRQREQQEDQERAAQLGRDKKEQQQARSLTEAERLALYSGKGKQPLMTSIERGNVQGPTGIDVSEGSRHFTSHRDGSNQITYHEGDFVHQGKLLHNFEENKRAGIKDGRILNRAHVGKVASLRIDEAGAWNDFDWRKEILSQVYKENPQVTMSDQKGALSPQVAKLAFQRREKLKKEQQGQPEGQQEGIEAKGPTYTDIRYDNFSNRPTGAKGFTTSQQIVHEAALRLKEANLMHDMSYKINMITQIYQEEGLPLPGANWLYYLALSMAE